LKKEGGGMTGENIKRSATEIKLSLREGITENIALVDSFFGSKGGFVNHHFTGIETNIAEGVFSLGTDIAAQIAKTAPRIYN
jgi:flagellar motor switch protein FliM